MGKIQTKKTLLSAFYSFAIDGGAISSINMGIMIPIFSIVTRFYVRTITAAVGSTATIAFGHSADTDAFMVVTGEAMFNAGETMQGIDFGANPLLMTAARQLQITIATAALTAGVIQAHIEFTEEDF